MTQQSLNPRLPGTPSNEVGGQALLPEGRPTESAATLPAVPAINPTPDLIVTAPLPKMRSLFAKYVQEAAAHERLRRREMNVNDTKMLVDNALAERLASVDEMEARDFVDAFTLFDAFDWTSRDEASRERLRQVLRIDAAGEGRTRMASVRTGLKYAYLKLWADGAVLFPLHFRMGRSLRGGQIKEILPPVATCHTESNDQVMAAFGFALTLASSWRSFSDIDLDAFGAYELDLCRDFRKREILGARRRDPYSPFTAALWTWYHAGKESGFRYSEAEVRGYLYWVHRVRAGTISPDEKPSEFIPTTLERRKGVLFSKRSRAERRQAAAQIDLLDNPRKAEFKAAILAGQKSARDIRFEVAHDQVASPDDILVYAKLLRVQGGRRQWGDLYPVRMHAYPTDVWATWNDIFERFLEFRKRQGYESTVSMETFRFALQDYLCCYLPWWIELSPDAGYALPADPSLVVRFGSWIEGDARHAPLPLLRFFDRTRAGSSPENFNSFIANAHKFWDFCRAQAPRLNLARASFDNPVVPQMDRLVKHSHQKTNKNPIPASVLPYLLRYAYACEGFFMDLSARSLAGALTDEERKYVNHTIWTFGTFDPARFGLKVGFEFEDKRHEIGSIPLLAPWWDRFVKCEQGDTTAFLPALSGLRMVIGALETGIRFQGIQWLDRKTYRSLADDGAPGSELVPLVVNTDKVRDRPWKTLIVRRAYDLLRREEAYQDLLADAFVDRPVFYERREHSRFAPVLPLFRGPQSSQPVADGAYTTAWERLIVGFSLWYERHVPGAEPLRMWRYVPDTEPGTRKPRVTMHVEGEEQRPCCLLKVKLRHTPHSARSTFISARSGILPIEVTGWLVGHTNRATTYHYTVEEERKLKAKLIAASNALWAPDRDNPVHIRADAVNSALRKSFESNPGQTVAAFGLQSISLLNVDASDTDGISVLRSTAMSYVTFRETHICPVGEACPSNVMDVIVEPRRCGLCPLAIRSVDHLPSIAAKMRRLLEQVREGAQVVERYRRRGEPAASVAEVNQRRRLDVMEYEGWKTALVLLTKTLAELGRGSADAFHVGMPDAVRLHLRLVTRDADAAEFILQRIVDSHGHAAFETPLVRAQAAQLRQRLLASTGVVEAEMDRVQDDPVAALVSSLRLVLQARGIAPTFRAALETVRARCALGPGEAMPSLPEPGSA